MKLLVLTDVHAEEEAIERVRTFLKGKKYDAVLVLGDITNNGPVSFAEDFLNLFKEANVRVYALFGNMDTKGVRELLEKRGVALHLKRVELGKWNLVGFGGSRASLNSPSEFPEEQIYRELNAVKIDRKTILATHSPPFNCGLDKTKFGNSIGSTGIRRIIEEKKPALNLCGHVHETEGEKMIGATRVVKVAPVKYGRAAEVELGETARIKFIAL